MTHRPGPDFARALADHTVVTGPISGIWSCSSDTCTAQSRDHIAGVLTSKDERQEQWRTHLAEVLDAHLRDQVPAGPCEAHTETLSPLHASPLPAWCNLLPGHAGRHEAKLTGGGTATWPDLTPPEFEVEWGVRVEHTYLDGYVSAVGSERAAIQHCAVREGQSMETTTTKLRRFVTPWEDVL